LKGEKIQGRGENLVFQPPPPVHGEHPAEDHETNTQRNAKKCDEHDRGQVGLIHRLNLRLWATSSI
jgi:hypothetical protein